MRRLAIASCFVCSVCALAAPAAADTIISGGTVINQEWTLAGSPYIVQGDVTVPNGAFLTIDPGVVVQAANGDSQMSSDTSRVEIFVQGTLTAMGGSAAGQGITFSGASVGSWYGLIVDPAATAVTMANVTINNALRGISYASAGNVLAASAVTVTNASQYGLITTNGSLTVDGLTVIGAGSAGVYVGGSASLALTGCVLRNNASYGVLFTPSSPARTLSVTGCTLNSNGSYGVRTTAASAGTVTVTNSIITNHSAYGVAQSDTSSVTTTYSDVWNNASANFLGGTTGTGVLNTNPLYVSATNLRLTANSPARFGGSAGGDQGALAYVNDPTPGLYGTLWVNTVLSAAGSPYTVAGDLTIGPSATLTVQPGVTLSFASGDIMQASDTSRAELIVSGTLVADGTPAQQVNLSGATASSGSWYGVELIGAGASTLDNVTIGYPLRGVSIASGANHTLTALNVQNASQYGVIATAGSPTLDGLTVVGAGSAGVYVGTSASMTLTNCVLRNNASYGVLFTPSSPARTLAVTNCTLNSNGSYGVRTTAASAGTVTITNSIITNHSAYGVAQSDTSSVTTTYSDVWNNASANFLGGTTGTGVIATNPLYVSASNLRLTANSPARFGGNAGGDQGALPYVSDPTPGLYGTLWVNTTLTPAMSPYTVAGDLTVAPSVTVTVQPGVTLSFASGDVMQASDTSRAELIVNGTLIADGTPAQPVTLAGATASAGSWYGVELLGAGASTLDNVTISYALRGLSIASSATHTLTALNVQNASQYGVIATAGSPVLDGLTVVGAGSAGVYVGTSASMTLTNCVLRNNASYGVLFTPSSPARALAITNCTLNSNGSYGVRTTAASAGTVTVTNSIVTNHSAYGVAQSDTSSVTTAYSDVWNNASANFLGGTTGAGVQNVNPQYVSATNLHLLGSSLAIDTGTTGPNHDADGVVRPQDGNGIGGAQWDLGAYEFVLVPMCGNGAVEPGEACDSGAANGSYGACNSTCTGLGPRCGDTMVNGPEQCDDGNGSNSDACLTTCRNATCGDGFVEAGVEQCDDGNAVPTDACTATCMTARCGDGVVETGVEQCDDGNTIDTDACRNNCTRSTCGDGVVETGEQCDDGNQVDTDACRNSCMSARCGDGVVETGVEQCDDGNTVATDACTATCMNAVCGDGITRAGVEECDDGNTSNGDACVTGCVAARCGDGFVRAGVEGCDDGNSNNNDACTNACVSSTCGDGVVQAGVETCDDANQIDTDACRNNCTAAMCGDGVVESGVEQCDDGNTATGDGCGATCQLETGPDGAGDDQGGGGGCCSTGGPARDTSLLAALGVLLVLRRRRGDSR